MAIIFNGKDFARKKELELKKKVVKLKQKGIYPKLASILIGNNPSNKFYVELKKKVAERIGAELDIYFLTEKSTKDIVLTLIDSLNKDETINGVMIQMPLPENLKDNKAELIKSIDQEKDVDGLRENSKFLHPTSRAIIEIIDNAKSEINLKDDLTYVVVGATGMVGAPLSKELKKKGLRVIECDNKTRDLKAQTLKADILVSATGVHDLIREDMVGNGVSIIDVGYPKGDVDFDTVSKKSSFITPVPGGVGPVTITCLLENLVEACYNPSS